MTRQHKRHQEGLRLPKQHRVPYHQQQGLRLADHSLADYQAKALEGAV
jgi:hypothetical protein